jgi:predicted phosphoribosyltransferase
VGARDSCQALRPIADDVVCPFVPDTFRAVGLWYADFSETTDDEVRQLLAARRSEMAAQGVARSA